MTQDDNGIDDLSAAAYDELRRLAGHYLASERRDHTLQPTALVHEAYLKLLRGGRVDVAGRSHFVGIAARVMRQILVDHAKAHQAAKRGGGRPKLTLEDVDGALDEPAVDLIALDEAMNMLAELDPRLSQMVELRFFGGQTNKEVAEVLGVSESTVAREWSMARAWLHRWLGQRD